MRTLLIIAVPLLCSLVSAVAAWFLATRRTERRLHDDMRKAETKLATALANSERQDEVIREHARLIAQDLDKKLNTTLRAELARINPGVDSAALIVEIDDKLSERMSALLGPLSGIVKAVEKSSAATMTQTSEALGNIRKALRELNDTLDSTRDSAELKSGLESLQADLRNISRNIGDDLRDRLDAIITDAGRTSASIEEFRWETLRSDGRLPWEKGERAAEA